MIPRSHNFAFSMIFLLVEREKRKVAFSLVLILYSLVADFDDDADFLF